MVPPHLASPSKRSFPGAESSITPGSPTKRARPHPPPPPCACPTRICRSAGHQQPPQAPAHGGGTSPISQLPETPPAVTRLPSSLPLTANICPVPSTPAAPVNPSAARAEDAGVGFGRAAYAPDAQRFQLSSLISHSYTGRRQRRTHPLQPAVEDAAVTRGPPPHMLPADDTRPQRRPPPSSIHHSDSTPTTHPVPSSPTAPMPDAASRAEGDGAHGPVPTIVSRSRSLPKEDKTVYRMTFDTARATMRDSFDGRCEEGDGNGLGRARAQDAQRLRSACLGSRSSVASSDPAARIHAARSSPLRRISVSTSLSSPAPASKHLPAPRPAVIHTSFHR
ncbi:hypothetical protein V8E36_005735 [Tilletia maclaganii]